MLALIAIAACASPLAPPTPQPTSTTAGTPLAGSRTPQATSTRPATSPPGPTIAPTSAASPTPSPTPLPAVAVVGWEGEGVRVVSLEVEFNYAERASDLEAIVLLALGQVGLDVGDDPDAIVRVDLEGTPLSARYTDAGECHSGARISGTVRLTGDGMPRVEAPLEGSVPTPFLISACEKDPAGAPFEEAFEMGFSSAMAEILGPASVPYLSEVLAFPRSGYWSVILPIQAAAIDAYRTLDHDAIPIAHQYEFLDQVLWSVAPVIGNPDPEGDKYIRTVRRVLLDYSETNFGFANEDDLESWRQWLTEWAAERDL